MQPNFPKGSPQGKQATFILTSNEVAITLMALAGLLETFEETKQYAWNHEAKRDRETMMAAANSAKQKLEQVTWGGAKMSLPEYNEGDENQFLEKK